jgi:hypothetical protein
MGSQINQISRLARQIANNPGKIRNTAAMKKRLILMTDTSLNDEGKVGGRSARRGS